MRPFRSDCTCHCHTPGLTVRHMAACCKPDPTIEELIQAAADLAQEAYDNGDYDHRCMEGEAVFYYPHTKGLVPGHIYSELGLDEYGISKSCEYHFDEWCSDDED